jgi:diadenosine tetraphosphate (Ap4A) HIT family hydrolase
MSQLLLTDANNRLAWQRFREGAMQRGDIPPRVTQLDDCLMCSTDHFFVIVGSGAFIPGYLIIVTKQPYRSFAEIPESLYPELRWLIHLLSTLLEKQYQKNVVTFEHGMCGCSGADNAHLHLMPVSRWATCADFRRSIDRVLNHRGIGITDAIDRELQREFRSDASAQEVWTVDQLQRLPIDRYPRWIDRSVLLQKYVYFNAPFDDASFLTTVDLGSQVGREIIFEVEKYHSKTLQKALKQMARSQSDAYGKLVWRWQDFEFKENMVKTMHHLAEPLSQVIQTGYAKRFGFQSSFAGKVPGRNTLSPAIWESLNVFQASPSSISAANLLALCCIAEKIL